MNPRIALDHGHLWSDYSTETTVAPTVQAWNCQRQRNNGLRWLEIQTAQLPARGDAELSVDVLKVILDCLPAHIELGCRLRVGVTLRHEYGNVPLTVGQIERGSGRSPGGSGSGAFEIGLHPAGE